MKISSHCNTFSYFFLNLGSLLEKLSTSLVMSIMVGGRPGGGTVRSHGIVSADGATLFFFLYSSKLMTVRLGADCSGFTEEGTGIGNVGARGLETGCTGAGASCGGGGAENSTMDESTSAIGDCGPAAAAGGATAVEKVGIPSSRLTLAAAGAAFMMAAAIISSREGGVTTGTALMSLTILGGDSIDI